MKPFVPFVFLIACFFSLSSFAQRNYLDSLRNAVKSADLNEREKPALLNQLAEAYRVNKSYKMAMAAARQSIGIALRNKDYTEANKAFVVLINSKILLQDFVQLKQLTDTTLTLAKQTKDPVAQAYAAYAQVLLYKALDNKENLVKFCQLGLKELEKKTDHYLAAKIYYQLYALNANWDNAAKVFEYAKLATEHAHLANDFTLLSNCYNAMSTAHEYRYNARHEQKELDSSLFYLQKAEGLYGPHGLVNNLAYAISCINLANMYFRYFPPSDSKAKNLAIGYAKRAREVLNNWPDSQEVLASSLGILSEYAKRDGNEKLVEQYLLEAYRIIQTGKPPLYYNLINIGQALTNLYRQKGNYEKALQFQEEVNAYTVKNFDQQKALQVQKLEIQYETEKKNNEVKLLKEREKSQRQQSYLYAGIAVATVLCLLFMFRSYHFRLRYSLQREKQLGLEQQLLATQQQQLKKEVMANVLQLEHKNQMLHNLKDKLTVGDEVNMQKILREEMLLDNDFEQAKLQIQQVHPDFFQLLNKQAQKKLTLLDLKLCAYLYLQMDTRQIAQLMHVEAKSVRMSRYRIKQKLGLDKEDDLNRFLQSLNG